MTGDESERHSRRASDLDDLADLELAPDGVRVVVTMTSPATIGSVWSALTIDEEIAEWLNVTFTIDARPGGSLRFEFGDGDICTGVVTDAVPERLLAYDWAFPDGLVMHLVWRLAAAGDATTLQLVHSGVPSPQAASFAAGWHAHFEQLAAHLRGEASPRQTRRAEVFTPRFRELLPAYERTARDLLARTDAQAG